MLSISLRKMEVGSLGGSTVLVDMEIPGTSQIHLEQERLLAVTKLPECENL